MRRIKTFIQTVAVIGATPALLAVTASVGTVRPAMAQLEGSGSLTVNVTGLKNAVGQVCFSLFEGSQGFPNDPEAVVAQQCVPAAVSGSEADGEEAAAETIAVTFDSLEMGTYAVSVLHDEDEDQAVGRGTFGIPTEGFGFSQNPVVQTSAPEFTEAALFVIGDITTDIEMVYF